MKIYGWNSSSLKGGFWMVFEWFLNGFWMVFEWVDFFVLREEEGFETLHSVDKFEFDMRGGVYHNTDNVWDTY